MADRESALAIVIRTVDKATAGLRSVNAAIKSLGVLTAPLQLVGERLGALGKEAGLPQLGAALKGVGGSVKSLFGNLKGDILGLGIGLGVVVHQVMSMVDEFDDLGDKAERVGVTVDFLASMRYAAERSGASIEELDAGMRSFAVSIGLAKAGNKKLVTFLQATIPSLLTQLKLTKDTEGAFRLVASAMSKLSDPAKRLALAQKLGLGAALAPLLARGPKELLELQGEFAGLAGSLDPAAEGAGAVDDALKKLKASTLGVKGALIAGLAPAIQEIVESMTGWLVGHRDEIRAWASDIGKKLPGAVRQIKGAILGAIGTIGSVVDAIGGWKVAAVALGLVLAGPLLASIYGLSAALLTTPVGWIITAIGLIGLAAYELIKHWDGVKAFFRDLWDRFGNYILIALGPLGALIKIVGVIIDNWEPITKFFGDLWDDVVGIFKRAWKLIGPIVDGVVAGAKAVRDAASFILGSQEDQRAAAVINAGAEGIDISSVLPEPAPAARGTIDVRFSNAPRGLSVTTTEQSGISIDTTTGYQLAGGGVW